MKEITKIGMLKLNDLFIKNYKLGNIHQHTMGSSNRISKMYKCIKSCLKRATR